MILIKVGVYLALNLANLVTLILCTEPITNDILYIRSLHLNFLHRCIVPSFAICCGIHGFVLKFNNGPTVASKG